MTNKERFLELLSSVERQGIDDVIAWLQNSDFFEAPCSTKYHLNVRGGLCQHSLNVYESLMKIASLYKDDEYIMSHHDSIIIVSLLHDICKADFYKRVKKPVKKGTMWIEEIVYVIDDNFPFGHGEKSAMILSSMMPLTNEELLAIRWHMGAWDNAVKGGDYSISTALQKYNLVSMLQSADFLSTYILEQENNDDKTQD